MAEIKLFMNFLLTLVTLPSRRRLAGADSLLLRINATVNAL